jgi:hypothetical protein
MGIDDDRDYDRSDVVDLDEPASSGAYLRPLRSLSVEAQIRRLSRPCLDTSPLRPRWIPTRISSLMTLSSSPLLSTRPGRPR